MFFRKQKQHPWYSKEFFSYFFFSPSIFFIFFVCVCVQAQSNRQTISRDNYGSDKTNWNTSGIPIDNREKPTDIRWRSCVLLKNTNTEPIKLFGFFLFFIRCKRCFFFILFLLVSDGFLLICFVSFALYILFKLRAISAGFFRHNSIQTKTIQRNKKTLKIDSHF